MHAASMNHMIRMILCAALAALAITLAAMLLAGFRPRQGMPDLADSMFYLAPSGGKVAVFIPEQPETPVTVTAIELDSLRERDRDLIAAGMPVSSREELAQLLEDLGS